SNSRVVVVAEYPIWPSACRQRALVLLDEGCDGACIPCSQQQMKIEGQVHTVEPRAVVGDQAIDREVDLPDQDPIGKLIDDAAHLSDQLLYLGPVGVV